MDNEFPTLLISVVAISISMLTLGWTIYRDAIQKPRFRTSIALGTIHNDGMPPDGPHIMVDALNLGPIANRMNAVYLRKSLIERLFNRKEGHAIVHPDWRHPMTTPANSRIEVGDTGRFVFPYQADPCFLDGEFSQIGVSDGYGRIHWAPRNQFWKLQKAYIKKFGAQLPT